MKNKEQKGDFYFYFSMHSEDYFVFDAVLLCSPD